MSNKTHRTNPDSQLILPPGAKPIQVIEHEGFIFPANPHPAQFPMMYLCYAARHDDKNAADFLDMFGVTVNDLRGQQYWPMVDESKLDAPLIPGEPTPELLGESAPVVA